MVTATFKVEAYLSGSWVTLTNHLLRSGLSHYHGISGNAPMDVVAGTGEFHFELRNDADASHSRLLGQFSPGHANCLSGWDYNVPIRVIYNDGSDRQRWTGKVAEIAPDADPKGRRTVRVVAYDKQRDLIEADVLAIAPQVNQTDSALIGVVLDSLPTDAQPLSRSIATGLDTIKFAFNQLGDRAKAASAIADVTRSGYALQYTSGAGVFTYKTREQRFSGSSIATVGDNELSGFSGPTSRAGSYNAIRVKYHTQHEVAGIVLWEYTGSTAQVIRAGETIELKTYYRDPNQTSREIGASLVTTPVAGTDLVANELADGSGASLTGNLVLTGSVYGTTYTAWKIQNTGSQNAWIGGDAGTWRVRGTGIIDDGEQIVEKSSVQPYGRRPLDIDLPLQSDRYVAAGLASLILSQRESPTNIPQEIIFYATRNSTLMTLALTAEIGDIITVSNSMTGVSSSTCAIQRIELEPVLSKTGNTIVALRATFGVSPTSALVAPTTPTGLAVANTSDSELTPSWTNTDASAETEVYIAGVLVTVAAAGATSALVPFLTRATNYSITVKHSKYALLRSSATSAVVGRPTVTATGGTITTPGDGNKYHTVTTSTNFLITGRGRVSGFGMGGGGGAGSSSRSAIGSGAGGGGDYFSFIDNDEPTSASQGLPLGFPVVIGAGGAGDTTGATQGSDGSTTTYRGEAAGGGSGGGTFEGSGGAHDGTSGAVGGGGAGEFATGGVGTRSNGGDGAADGSGQRPGGGGGGAGGAGGAGVPGSTSGGARGAGITMFGVPGFGTGGKGGGSAETPANASAYGCGGDGVVAAVDTVRTDGKNGFQGIAVFWYPI